MLATTPLVVPTVAFEPVPEWLPEYEPEYGRYVYTGRVLRFMGCHYATRALPVWLAHYPDDQRPLQAIRNGMLYADGEPPSRHTSAAYPYAPASAPTAVAAAVAAAYAVMDPEPDNAATFAARSAATAARYSSKAPRLEEPREREVIAQNRLKSLYVPRKWHRKWRTNAVYAMSEAIYAGQEWHLAPILAQALEDAGCTDANWLSWLRSEELRPHWHRGQWPWDFGRGV